MTTMPMRVPSAGLLAAIKARGGIPAAPPPEMIESQPLSPSFSDGVSAGQAFTEAANLPIKQGGFFSRLGELLKQPGMSAALLRSGAATLNGGLGAGIEAGAAYMDKRGEREAEAAAGAEERQQRNRALDIQENLGLGKLALDEGDLFERRRSNRAKEGVDRYGIEAGLKKHVTASGDTVARESAQNWRHSRPTGTAVLNEQGQNFRHVNPSGNAILNERGANYRHGTVSADTRYSTDNGAKNLGFSETVTTQDAVPAEDNWFGADVPAQPKVVTTTRTPVAPSQVQPNSGPVRISSDADYAALPSGAKFMGPDGVLRQKP